MSSGFTRAHAAILVTAVLFSTGGAAIKACGLAAWQVAGFRSGIAALVMALLVPAARQVSGPILLVAVGLRRHADFLRPGQQAHDRGADGVPAGGGAALRRLPGAVAPRHPRVAAGRAGARARRPRRDPAVPRLGASSATAPDPARGNAIAIVSGVFYACLMVGLRWLAERASPAGRRRGRQRLGQRAGLRSGAADGAAGRRLDHARLARARLPRRRSRSPSPTT